MEDLKMKKPLHMLCGVNIGDYEFKHDTIIDVVKKYKFGLENGNLFRYLQLRVDQGRPTKERLYEWAKYLADNEVYFQISNNYPRIGELYTILDKEDLKILSDVGGEYFLGDDIGEFGGWYSSRAKGYRMGENPVQGMTNCQEAKDMYVRQVGKIVDLLHGNGAELVGSCQAVAAFPYDYDAGADYMLVEIAPRNMEILLNFARGSQRAYRKDVIGAWLAHEFYGGYHQEDPLKAKRFKMEYYDTYLAGFDFICLESGFRGLYSHVEKPLPADHPLAKSYLKETEDFAQFCNKDIRPGKNGPITKVAFVQGNLDGYMAGNSGFLWGQFYDKQWGFKAPEFSYRILDEVYHGSEWNDGRNAGDHDYSNAPGYGVYDVIPATTPLDVMKQYEWVIFCGWNTMTPEIYETLKAYVKGGGKVLISAAHMRDSIDRNEKGNFVGEDIEEFIGAKIGDGLINTCDGFKFSRNSIAPGVIYPGTLDRMTDPAWSGGYTDYVKVEPTTAHVAAYVSDTFLPAPDRDFPAVIENKYGDGYVIFMATSEYPGAPEVFPLYKIMTKQVLCASHRTSDIKVIGSDKLRFAVYGDEENYKVYILNTDYNSEQRARVYYNGELIFNKLIDVIGVETVEFKK